MDLRNEKLAIIEVQQNLLELFQAGASLPFITPDGIYGSKTRQAVSDFQSQSGIRPTGIVDYLTWTLLAQDADRALAKRTAAIGIYPFASILRGGSVRIGEISDLVRIMQIMLSSLSLYDLEGTAQTGTFDTRTEEALQKFQALHHLDPDGVLNLTTWNALADAYNRTQSGLDTN
ncbi:MAG: peptidoglycan-binding protein [Eubacteriales bacterium]